MLARSESVQTSLELMPRLSRGRYDQGTKRGKPSMNPKRPPLFEVVIVAVMTSHS